MEVTPEIIEANRIRRLRKEFYQRGFHPYEFFFGLDEEEKPLDTEATTAIIRAEGNER